jgi:hypothetical protein
VRCGVTLHVLVTNAGTVANDFHAFSILQTRSAQLLLR